MARAPSIEPSDEWVDPVVEAYKAGIDRTLLAEQLRRTPEERLRRVEDMQHAILELRRAALDRGR